MNDNLKIAKLKELAGLLKEGVITEGEFENLKKQIIESEEKTKTVPKETTESTQTPNNPNLRTIMLSAFFDNQGKTINAPKINRIDINNISGVEAGQLKPFLRLKQIHAPAQMTADEIELTNKMFSYSDICIMNSERPGFNYAFVSGINVLGSGISLYLLTVSPCFGFLGAGSLIIYTIAFSIFVLNRADSTQMDKRASYITLALDVIAFMVLYNGLK
jgi:hypothetical protein